MKALDPDKIERILVRGTNWVGDAVMSVPALREIRRLFPGAHISLLVRPWVRDVFSAVSFIDDILVYDKNGRHRGWRGFRRMAAEIRGHRFDLAILLQNAFEAAAIAWLASIPIRVGYGRDRRSLLLTHPCPIDPEVRGVHQVYYYLGILSAVGLLPPGLWRDVQYQPSIEIGVSEMDRAAARTMLRDCGIGPDELIIGVNPGAYYGSAKRWLTDRYASAADELAHKHAARIVIFGSAQERAIAEEIALSMKHKPVLFAGRTTLGQLMGLILECGLLITNDSGPMHLAAALNVPQVAIFGSTSAAATGPRGPRAQVVQQPVECSPCFLRECPIDFRCMKRVSVDMVLTAAERKLAESERAGTARRPAPD